MFDPPFYYQVFNEYPDHPTSEPMNRTGTWSIPVVLIHTPAGLIYAQGPEPAARHLLIEGYQRMRYLNALVQRGRAAAEHRVFFLKYDEIKSPQN